jgi:hypothetical protein
LEASRKIFGIEERLDFDEPFCCLSVADSHSFEGAVDSVERITGLGVIGGNSHAAHPHHEHTSSHCERSHSVS